MIEIFAQIVVPLAALAIIAAHEKHEAEGRAVEPVPSFAGSVVGGWWRPPGKIDVAQGS